jgi:hypothetical protein
MSSDATAGSVADPSRKNLDELQAKVETLEAELSDLRSDVENGPKKMVIITTKGTLDMAYPPLILASTAAAFGYDVTVFHTFWGSKSSTNGTQRISSSVRSATRVCRCRTPSLPCRVWPG